MELLVNFSEPQAGLYRLSNGETYRVTDIAKCAETQESLVVCYKVDDANPGHANWNIFSPEKVVFPLSAFLDGRFKEVYDLDADIETLDRTVGIIEDLWPLRNDVAPKMQRFMPRALRSIPGICQRMKAVLAEVRNESTSGANL